MYPRKLVLGLFGLMVAGAPAAVAQEQGSIEIGVFVRTGWFDDAFSDDDDLPIGVGGNAGLYLIDNLELQVSGSFSSITTIMFGPAPVPPDSVQETAPGQFEHSSFRSRLIYGIPVREGWAFNVGAGWVHNRFTGDVSGNSNGITGLLGIRGQVADLAAVTANVIGDYQPSPVDQLAPITGETFNWGVELGLQVFVLGGFRS